MWRYFDVSCSYKCGYCRPVCLDRKIKFYNKIILGAEATTRRLWVRPPLRGIKYLISSFRCSRNEAKSNVELLSTRNASWCWRKYFNRNELTKDVFLSCYSGAASECKRDDCELVFHLEKWIIFISLLLARQSTALSFATRHTMSRIRMKCEEQSVFTLWTQDITRFFHLENILVNDEC